MLLPNIPFTDLYTVMTFYEQNIINAETRDKMCLSIAGMKWTDRATEPNKHVRPPVRGSDTATTEIMARKAAVMRAEQKKLEAEAKKIEEEHAQELKMGQLELDKLDKEIELQGAKLKSQIATQRA